jgi:hypothetical protein
MQQYSARPCGRQHRIRQTAIVPLISLFTLLFAAGLASAAPAVPKGETFTFLDAPAGQVCPFNVLVTATARQLTRTTLPNGVQVITGPGTATVTNKETDKSATYNISGPGKFDQATGRLVLFGQSLIVQPMNIGPPFLITTSGKVSFIINQQIDEPLRGHISHDICTELV